MGVSFALVGFCSTLRAEPPERFRLDLSAGYFNRPLTVGFIGGALPRLVLAGPSHVALFDVSGTLNVTEGLSIAAGLPFGYVSGSRRGNNGFGLGDVYGAFGYLLLDESSFFPSTRVRIEGGGPTASLDALGAGLPRASAGLTVSKSLHPRFAVFLDASHSRFFEQDDLELKPVSSIGGGFNIGVTDAHILDLYVEQVFNGEVREKGVATSAAIRDLRAGIGLTLYSKGRPRSSFNISVAGLQDKPTAFLTLKFALLSF
jgi:hypothetical protein